MPPYTPPIVSPYIGVTGAVTDDDVRTLCDAALLLRASHWRLMAGVLVSSTTLRHGATESLRYPTIERANKLLEALGRGGTWPVVHFNTRMVGAAFTVELQRLLAACPAAQGVQLNVAGPDPERVAFLAARHGWVTWIAQANSAALRDRPSDEIARFVQHHRGWASAVLIDRSAGAGVAIDPVQTHCTLLAVRRDEEPPMLGVAGGLGPGSETLLRELQASFAPRVLSCDAESGVRVPLLGTADPAAKHQDRMDRALVLRYVAAARQALEQGLREAPARADRGPVVL